MSDTVKLSVADQVAEVTLNRPEKQNAVDMSVFEGLAAIGTQITQMPDVRAVILRGEGENFCSGIDTSLFGANPDPKALIDRILSRPEGDAANVFQKPVAVWRDVPVPVIAAVTGACFGAGLQIALGADIRIAAPDARLSVMEIKWGLIPDMGISTLLPRLCRSDVAKELCFSGRIVEAQEAVEIGLLTRLTETPLEDARAMARLIASKNPDAIRRNKHLIDEAWLLTKAEALRLEAELQSEVIGQPNQLEAVFAQMQKRAPIFC